MKENELRIGNLLDLYGTIATLQGEDFYHHYSINERKLSRFKPIPLTEEWLLKFGFIKYGTLHDSYRLNPFIVELDILGNHYTFRKIMNKEESILLKEMKHVHQLQNLYFALTEKELNIK